MSDLATTIDHLTISVAKGFDTMDTKFTKKIDEINENIKATRQDVLKIGDRFVPRYEFDSLLVRVVRIEQKIQRKN